MVVVLVSVHPFFMDLQEVETQGWTNVKLDAKTWAFYACQTESFA